MSSFGRKILLDLLKLSDICILMAALIVASWSVTHNMNQMTFEEFLALRVKVVNVIGLLGMLFLWHLIFNGFQLYRSRRLSKRFQEWKDIFKATTVGTAIFMLAGFIFRISAFTPLFITVFWISSTALTILFRSLLRSGLKKVRIYGRNLRFILIVGTNQSAYDFAHKIEDKKESGYRICGYIDKKIHTPKDIKFLGNLEDFPEIIKKHVIDEVVIALPAKTYYEDVQKIVQKAEEQGIVVRYLFSQLFHTKIAQLRTEIFEDFAMLTMASGPQDNWQYSLKRAIDITLGTVLIILTSPVIVFAAIAIKLTSPGPIFFIQKRVGLNKRIFQLYKFRTMVVGAEKQQAGLEQLNEMDGPAFKIKNDPRITKIGRWLRKTSIDELPQLFNVLIGDMSLVGPRPLPLRDYGEFSKDWQRRRFSVLPGITCIWQANGRNTINFDDWMKLDMEYIDNWKLSTDLKILLKTIPSVIKGMGAS